MTLTTTTSRVAYPGAGRTGPFPFFFKIFAPSDLLVTKRLDSGAETTLVYINDYSVTGAGSAAGSVTLVTALTVGETLTIRRSVHITQDTSMENRGADFPSTIEDEFDKLVMISQGQQDQLDRSLKLSETYDPAAYSMNSIVPGLAGQVLGWANRSQITNMNVSAGAVVLPGQGRTVPSLSSYLANNAVFNVKDYGAVVNGIADDTTAINNTIAAASAAGGGTVLIPGFTKISATISITTPDITVVSWGTSGGVIPSTAAFNLFTLGPAAHRTKFTALWFKGASVDATTRQWAVYTNALAAPDDVEIASCVFGNYSLAGASLNDGIKIDGGNNWSVHHCTFRYFYLDISGTGYGILCGTTNKLHAYENNFLGNVAALRGRHAVYLSGGCTYCNVHNNVVEQYLEDAFPIYSLNYQTANTENHIHDNHIIGGGEGLAETAAISVDGKSSRNVIENNLIDGFNGFGVLVDAIGYVAMTDGNIVRENHIWNVKWAGIMNFGAQGTAILNNDIRDVSQLGANNYAGIYLRTSGAQVSDRVTVKGNKCRGTLIRSGLDAFDANQTNITIADNFFPDGVTSKLENCNTVRGQNMDFGLSPVSADRGDTSLTIQVGNDSEIQTFARTLSVNRTITLSTASAYNGARFRIVRTGLGAFTLAVGALKTIPSATAAFVDVMFNGSAWVLTGYGTL
jgi:hypothetical protein